MTQHVHPEFVRGLQTAQGPADTDRERRSTASRNVQRRHFVVPPSAQALQPSLFVPAPPLPVYFDWNSVYGELREQFRRHDPARDIYAVRGLTESIEAIGAKVKAEYRFYGPTSSESTQLEPEAAYSGLCGLKDAAGRGTGPRRALSVVVRTIKKLTHEKQYEQRLRAGEFAALSSEPTRICDPHGLGDWLSNALRLAHARSLHAHGQGDDAQAHAARIECQYFGELNREHAKGRDPWVVSREIRRKQAQAPRATQDRLEAAHRRLLRAMVDSASQTAAESTSEGVHAPVAPSHPNDQPEPATTGPTNQTEAATTGPTSRHRRTSINPGPAKRAAPSPAEWGRNTAYSELKARYRQWREREHATAVDLHKDAIDAIDHKVMEAYCLHFPTSSTLAVIAPEAAYLVLCDLRSGKIPRRDLRSGKIPRPSRLTSGQQMALTMALTNVDRLVSEQNRVLAGRIGGWPSGNFSNPFGMRS